MIVGELKRNLKSKAHALKPLILLGHQGLTEAVLKEINIALAYHELIKIKLPQIERAARQKIIDEILKETQADLVQSMGRIVTIYKEQDDDLPTASAKKATPDRRAALARTRN
jgi:RNA-binding protein